MLERLQTHLHQLDLGSVFMTVGDADTLWPPQLFSAVTFESQSLTENDAMAVLSDRLQHGKFEWGSLVFQYFGSHPAPGRLPWHVIAWCRTGIPT